MAQILKSVFLGLVQGLTEFLPISSSAHLNIFPWLFKWENISESFDLALHTGTLLAILVYFFKDWINLIVGGYKIAVKKEKSFEGRLFWYIVVATVPAGFIGKLCEIFIEKITENNINVQMIIISSALIILGVVLYIVDKRSDTGLKLSRMKFGPAFLIGFSQALAGAIPGVSRSGITVTVGRAYGLNREDAARYSFLLSAPMVGGAVLLSIKEFDFSTAFFAGVAASFISGLIVIKFFMKFLKKGSFASFACYRVVLGIIIMIIAVTRII